MSDHWRQFSKCAGSDPEMFYPSKGESSKPAKSICNGEDGRGVCPVKAQCLSFALSSEGTERYGVFGGMSAYERSRVFAGKQRSRGLRNRCAKGHRYTETTTYYVGSQRRCLICRDTVPSVEEHGHRYELFRDAAGHKRCRICYDSAKQEMRDRRRAERGA